MTRNAAWRCAERLGGVVYGCPLKRIESTVRLLDKERR